MLDSQRSEHKARPGNIPWARQAPRWFDPRQKDLGSWAFLLNRLTGLGLTFYLGLHLIVLHKLAQGQPAYDDFVAFSHSHIIKLGEVILIAAVVFHGLNGLRLILHAFGIGLGWQKIFFALALLCTIGVSILFTVHLFGE